MDEKSHENILVYFISNKIKIHAKSLCIRFDKADGLIRVFDGIRYLVLFGGEKYDLIYNRVRYIIISIGITYVFFQNYTKFKVDSYDPFLLEKTLNFHNVIIYIKSITNKDQIHYWYNMFLVKCFKNNDRWNC